MSPPAKRKSERASSGRKVPPPDEITEANDPIASVGPVIRWVRVGEVVTDLAATTNLDVAAWTTFERLAEGLVEPLRLLEELADLAAPALGGGEDARQRFAAHLLQAGLVVGAVGARSSRRGEVTPESGVDCCCGKSRTGSVRVSRRTIAFDAVADLSGDEQDDQQRRPGEIFYESALTTLLVAAASIALDGACRSSLSVEEATDTIVMLALDGGLLAALVRGHDEHGREGMLRALERASRLGHLSWMTDRASDDPPVMRMMSGGGPAGFEMPALPDGVPELPGPPGLRVDDFGIPGRPRQPKLPSVRDPLEEIIASLLKEWRRPTRWFPPTLDHKYPFEMEPGEYIDPFEIASIRCLLKANKLIRALNEPPPVPPLIAVWSTGISSVQLAGPCSGDRITIRGTGFGAIQSPNTTLLLPTLDGCRAVTPTSWSDTHIEAVLPARVASGSIGFGDTAYIAAYDAWAARMNDLERQLSSLGCSPRPIRFVPPFSQCPPVSSINTITAGAPEIVAFTANDETVHVLGVGEPLTLQWTVKNAASTRIDRVSASGAPFAGSTTLSPPAAQNSHAFGPQNHVTIEEWTYRLTVSGACGGPISRTITVVTAKQPRLRVTQMQVTQSIQTPDHSVKLVAGKPTVLRVLVDHDLGTWGGGTVPGVVGRVRMWRSGSWSQWIDAASNSKKPMQATPGAAITVPVLPSMNNTNDTLNFILPPAWCSGTAFYEVEVRVSGFGATPNFGGYSERVVKRSVSVNYANRRILQFRYVRVNWNGKGEPTDEVCDDTLRAAVPLLPTASAGIAPLPGQGIHNRSSTIAAEDSETTAAEASERRDMLNDFDDAHNCSTFESLTELLGADCPNDDGAIWVLIPGDPRRGEAYATPSNVCYTPPSNGPYAAHEIAHCLNQEHVRLPATGPNVPQGGVAASAWPANGMLTDVPFDSRGSYTGLKLDPRALSLAAGTGVADVMTYWGTPNNTWPTPRRWEQLWNEIGP